MLPRGTNETAYQKCGRGYTGVKCQQCSRRSYKYRHQCLQCPNSLILFALAFVLACFGFALFVALIVWSASNTARDTADSFSVSLKILIGWLQLTGLATTFIVNWPPLLSEFVTFQFSVCDFVAARPLSVDCLLQTILGPTMPRLLYAELFYIAIPILFVLVSGIVCGVMYIFRTRSFRRTLENNWNQLLTLAKARDKVLFDVMEKAQAEVKQGDSEAKKRAENELQAKLSFERLEFTHHVLESMGLSFKDYQLADMDRPETDVDGSEDDPGQPRNLAPDTLNDAESDWDQRNIRVKRYTDDVNSDTDSIQLLDVDDGVQGPESRALSAVVRQRFLMQRLLQRFKGTIRRNDVPGLEKLARHVRKYVLTLNHDRACKSGIAINFLTHSILLFIY